MYNIQHAYTCVGIFFSELGYSCDCGLWLSEISLKIDASIPEIVLLWFVALAVSSTLVEHDRDRQKKHINDISRDMPKLNICREKTDYSLELQSFSKALYSLL